MSEPYREGHEYVVCPECKSHILVSVEERRDRFEDEECRLEMGLGFTCDWDPCGADFSATVMNPRYEVRATACRRCVVCRGCTHHWQEGFDEDEDGEMVDPDDPRWTCKHCEFSMPYGDENPEAQYRKMRELGLVLPAEAAHG